ncbi:putative ribonuclease H-like domain-containing protein [Tanacetum coccineum]
MFLAQINHANKLVPRSVQLNTGRTNINSVRPKVNSVRPKVNSVRPKVNAVSPKVNTVRPRQPITHKTSNSMSPKRPQMNQINQRRDFSKSYSSVRRPFAKSTAQMAHSNAVMGSWGLRYKDQLEDFEGNSMGDLLPFGGSKTPPAKGFACLIAKATSDESKLWHRRLGHINFKNLNKLVKGNLVRGLPSKVFKNDHTCVACHKGKQHRASCKAKLERLITKPLHTLHMDLFGPTSVKSINHASYCLVITDDCTRFSWVFFLASKDETSGILQTFIRQIENQLSHRVKIIRSDNGTEFKNRDMLEFCGNKGIKQEYSNARTPQQNGVAERMNRTLIEAARTMLADSLLPTTFWAEAVSTACYIFNRVRVTKPQNKTPYELLFGHKPIISYIRPFGCHVTILDTLSVLGKFDGKSDEGFLVDKPNVKGVGYRWMFDIDYLTDSMNYIPVSLENQANPHAGASEVTNSAGTSQTLKSIASEEKDEEVELIVVPSAVKIPEEKDES